MHKILIIDADQAAAAGYRAALEQAGYGVDVAESSESALKTRPAEPPQLIVANLAAHAKSGKGSLELLRLLVKQSPGAKIVLLAASLDDCEVEDLLDEGCSGFLAQPVQMPELVRMAGEVLGRSGAPHIDPKDYANIPIDRFLSTRKVVSSVYLRFPSGKFVKLAHAGSDIDLSRLNMMKSRGLSELWIEKTDLHKYSNFVQKVAESAANLPQLTPERRAAIVLASCELAAENLRVLGLSAETITAAKASLATALTAFTANPKAAGVLVKIAQASRTLYTHSAMSGCFAALSAHILGWQTEKNIHNFTVGSFIHDVGLVEMPADLQMVIDANRLSPEDLARWHSHPTVGYETLMPVPDLPVEMLQSVLDHHETGAQSGFPRQIGRAAISPLTRMIAAIDAVVETIQFHRGWNPSAPETLEIALQRLSDPILDAAVLRTLLLLFGEKDLARAAAKYKIELSKRP